MKYYLNPNNSLRDNNHTHIISELLYLHNDKKFISEGLSFVSDSFLRTKEGYHLNTDDQYGERIEGSIYEIGDDLFDIIVAITKLNNRLLLKELEYIISIEEEISAWTLLITRPNFKEKLS